MKEPSQMRSNRRRGMLGVVALLLGVGLAWPAAAQPAGGDRPPAGAPEGWRDRDDPGEGPAGLAAEGEGNGRETRRERVRQRMRMLRAWRLTEVISVGEATAAQLFDLLDAYDEQVVEQQAVLEVAGRELRELLESGEGDDARVGELVEQILTAHLRIEEAQTRLVRAAGAFLTPRQQAALMLFLPEFDREMREMVRDVRRDRSGRRERREGRGEDSERGSGRDATPDTEADPAPREGGQ